MTSSPDPNQRRPRILHCVSHLALGGAERVAVTLTGALRAEISFGVCAIRGLGDGEMGRALEQELATLQVPLFTGPRVPMRYGGMLTGAIALQRAIRRFAPDLIHLHTEIPEASHATMLWLHPHLGAIPVVRTIHHSIFWHHWRPLGRWCDRQLSPAHIACVSEGARTAFQQLRSDSGAPESAAGATLIYNGVPERAASPTRSRQPSQLIRLVFGGRFEREKGSDLLPEILNRVRLPPKCSVQLTVFGSGKHQALLNRLASRPPTGWTVTVRAPTPEFRQELAEADLVIVPSRFEGLGLVAIEAFLAAVPVVATDAPGLREVLPPGYPWIAAAGDASSFAAAVSDALASPTRWRDVAALGRDFARQRFSVDAMAEGYRAVYRQLLQTGANPLLARPERAAVAEP